MRFIILAALTFALSGPLVEAKPVAPNAISKPVSSAPHHPSSPHVFVNKDRRCYHEPTCRYVRGTSVSIERIAASKKIRPCKVCHPTAAFGVRPPP